MLGLGVWWPVRGLLVVALWLLWVSMGQAMCVFDDVVRSLAEVWVAPLVVVGVDGAGYVRVRGCSRLWACVLAVVSVVWLLVGGRLLRVQGCGRACWSSSGSSRSSGLPAGGRLLRCWGGLVECSRMWSEVVAADLVVSRDGEASLGGVRLRLGDVRLRLGGVRLRSRLWVVGVTRKDV